jgi:hypothetical protein
LVFGVAVVKDRTAVFDQIQEKPLDRLLTQRRRLVEIADDLAARIPGE